MTRITAESRGGRTIADVFGGTVTYLTRLIEQSCFAPPHPGSGDATSALLKVSQFGLPPTPSFTSRDGTPTLSRKEKEPEQFEDLADSKWKNKLIAEPRDFQLLMGLAKRKYQSDEKAVDLFKKIVLKRGSNFTKVIRISLSCWWRDRRRFASLVIRTTLPPNKKRRAHSTDA